MVITNIDRCISKLLLLKWSACVASQKSSKWEAGAPSLARHGNKLLFTRILWHTCIKYMLAAASICSVNTYNVICQQIHTLKSTNIEGVWFFTNNFCTRKNIKIHFMLMLINAAVHTHTTSRQYGYWHNTTWSIEWACCLDEQPFNRKVSIFVEGHENVNAPQLATGSQSSWVSHNERWQTQRSLSAKNLCVTNISISKASFYRMSCQFIFT